MEPGKDGLCVFLAGGISETETGFVEKQLAVAALFLGVHMAKHQVEERVGREFIKCRLAKSVQRKPPIVINDKGSQKMVRESLKLLRCFLHGRAQIASPAPAVQA